MALIECYECGREISSLAPHCIHCGAPRKAQKTKKASEREASSIVLTERQREQIESDEEMSTLSAFLYLGGVGCLVITITLILNIFFNFGFFNENIPPIANNPEYSMLLSLLPVYAFFFLGSKCQKVIQEPGIRWKALIIQVGLFHLITFIMGALSSPPSYEFIVPLLAFAFVFLAIVLIGFFTKPNQYKHCVHFVFGLWISCIILSLSFGILVTFEDFISAILGLIFIAIPACVTGLAASQFLVEFWIWFKNDN